MNMHATIRPASMKKPKQSLWRIFAVPIWMGVLSVVGLVSALVGDEHWDWISWLTMTVPVLVIAYFMLWPARAR